MKAQTKVRLEDLTADYNRAEELAKAGRTKVAARLVRESDHYRGVFGFFDGMFADRDNLDAELPSEYARMCMASFTAHVFARVPVFYAH